MEIKNTAQRLALGSTLNVAVLVCNVVVSFFLMPFLIHALGDRWYGFWTVVGTFLGYYGFLDFGLTSAVSRFISRAYGTRDHAEMNTVINTSIVLFCGIGLMAFLISLAASASCHLFIENLEESALFAKVIAILGVSVGIGFPMRAFAGVLVSKVRYDLSAVLSLFKLFARTALIVYFVRKGHGILTLSLIIFAVDIASYVLNFFFVRSVFPEIEFGRRWFQSDRIRRMFNYSKYAFLNNLSDQLKFKVSSFVIAGYLNVSLVTHYYIGARLIEYFAEFMISAVGTLAPVFSQYEGRGDYNAIRRWLLSGTRLSVMMSFFIGSSLIFYGEAFITRWMGSGYESAYLVMVILVSGSIFDFMQIPGIGVLYGISKHNYYAIANSIEALLTLVFSLVFVHYYGIYGVAFASALEMYLFKLFIQPIYTCRAIRLPLVDYWFKTIAVTALKTLLPLGLYFFVVQPFLKADFISIFCLAALQTTLFLPVAFFWILEKIERQVLIDTLADRIPFGAFRRMLRSR
jgi:O-antigen/teichoic acid export membrane protein